MSDTPSPFIVPHYEATEGFESGSGSVSASGSASASAAPIVPEQTTTESSSEEDIAELEAALEAIPADGKPKGAGVVDSVFSFFATIIELIKYIFQSLSSGIGIDEFQFGSMIWKA